MQITHSDQMGSPRLKVSSRRRAARKEGINCNLTPKQFFLPVRRRRSGRLFNSPFVGRIYDWYQARRPLEPRRGGRSRREIGTQYLRYLNNIAMKTIVMGRFRRTEQILALTGCVIGTDLIISPNPA